MDVDSKKLRMTMKKQVKVIKRMGKERRNKKRSKMFKLFDFC
jgi:hypothetical protein